MWRKSRPENKISPEVEEKVENAIQELFWKLVKLRVKPCNERITVLIHGAANLDNIMFSYDELSGRPNQVRYNKKKSKELVKRMHWRGCKVCSNKVYIERVCATRNSSSCLLSNGSLKQFLWTILKFQIDHSVETWGALVKGHISNHFLHFRPSSLTSVEWQCQVQWWM